VHDMVPLLEEINTSLEESTNKMPRVSSQLDKVTQATELATTEILDSVEKMNDKIKTLSASFETAVKNINEFRRIEDHTMELLTAELAKSHPDLLKALQGLYQQKQTYLNTIYNDAALLQKSIRLVREESMEIMISLQVQDITSQQIAAVNHLIDSVQQRLSGLISRFKVGEGDLLEQLDAKEVAFNPDATYDRSDSKQKVVDNLIKQSSHPGDHNNANGSIASQEEIDKLFRKPE
ncbi:MAG: chemotaxis protein CheZ, partial [Candidatus Kryptoniota bacterium]